MALMARVCENCRTATAVVDETECQNCGDTTHTVDLIAAYTEQGQELRTAKDELAIEREGAPA